MITYLIIVISFAIMFQFRYINHAITVVKSFARQENLKKTNVLPLQAYSILAFIVNIIVAPLMFIALFAISRPLVIKIYSKAILKTFYAI